MKNFILFILVLVSLSLGAYLVYLKNPQILVEEKSTEEEIAELVKKMDDKELKVESTNASLANPASVYCENQSGKLEMREGDGGMIGYCKFSDGTECEEWAFFKGECGLSLLEKKILEELKNNNSIKFLPDFKITNLPDDANKTQAGDAYQLGSVIFQFILQPNTNIPLDISIENIKWVGILASADTGESWEKIFTVEKFLDNENNLIKFNPIGLFINDGVLYIDIVDDRGAGSGEGNLLRYPSYGLEGQPEINCYYMTPEKYYSDQEKRIIKPNNIEEKTDVRDCIAVDQLEISKDTETQTSEIITDTANTVDTTNWDALEKPDTALNYIMYPHGWYYVIKHGEASALGLNKIIGFSASSSIWEQAIPFDIQVMIHDDADKPIFTKPIASIVKKNGNVTYIIATYKEEYRETIKAIANSIIFLNQ